MAPHPIARGPEPCSPLRGCARLPRAEGGIGEGAALALRAGVDLVLVSYDPDQYYEVMVALLRAERAGRLDPAVLAESDARLARARGALRATTR